MQRGASEATAVAKLATGATAMAAVEVVTGAVAKAAARSGGAERLEGRCGCGVVGMGG